MDLTQSKTEVAGGMCIDDGPQTLPLFADLTANTGKGDLAADGRAALAGESTAQGHPRSATVSSQASLAHARRAPLFRSRAQCEAEQRLALQQRHLQAAKRLSRKMRQMPGTSVQRRQTGQAICRHLRAMLKPE